MTTKSEKNAEKQEAIEHLRKLLPPGSTVYTVLRHVSKSGMSRLIDCYVIVDGEPLWLSSWISKAVDFYPLDKKKEALRATGCGMDMGFSIVHNLSSVLYPDGFGCIGEDKTGSYPKWYCPSNDHSNGDRDFTPHGTETVLGHNSETGDTRIGTVNHWHQSGGYALKQKWM